MDTETLTWALDRADTAQLLDLAKALADEDGQQCPDGMITSWARELVRREREYGTLPVPARYAAAVLCPATDTEPAQWRRFEAMASDLAKIAIEFGEAPRIAALVMVARATGTVGTKEGAKILTGTAEKARLHCIALVKQGVLLPVGQTRGRRYAYNR